MVDNELRVFVAGASKNIGLYINVITQAVMFLGIRSIKFIKLENNNTLRDFDITNYVRVNINDKLRELSKIKSDIYRKAFDVFSNNKQDLIWDYQFLKREIKKEGDTLCRGQRNNR